MVRSIALALGLFVISADALARADEARKQAPPPARSSHVEHVTSEMVLIESYVTDAQSHPVRGLTLDDFVLEVDGARRTPASLEFHEIVPDRDGAGAPQAPSYAGTPVTVWPRRFVFFFEDKTSGPLGLTRARQAVDRFLDSGMTPTDQVALVAHDHGLRVLQDFTTDKAALHAAMERSMENAVRFNTFEKEQEDRFEQFLGNPTPRNATVLCLEEKADYVGVVQALETLVTSLAPWRGYKAVVFMGDGIPEWPMESWYQMLYRGGSWRGRNPLMLSLNGRDPAIFPLDCTLDTELKTVSRAVAVAGVTLHAVQTLGLVADDKDRLDRVAKQANSLQMLTLNTAGRFSASNDVFASLRQFEEDSRVYYTLGYVPEGTGDGKYHPIVVRCLRKGLNVSFRRGYTRLPPAEAHAKALEAAHTVPEMFSALDMTLNGAAGPLEGTARVMDLAVHVPPGKVLFLPEEGVATAHLAVGLVGLDDHGGETLRTSRSVVIRQPEAGAARGIRALDLFCRVRLPLDAQTVTAVVSDESADVIGGARLRLSAVAPEENATIVGFSLYSVEERSLWVELPPNSREADKEAGAAAYTIGPAMKGVFAPDEPVVAGFKLAPQAAIAPGSLRLEIRQGPEVVRSRPVDIGDVAAGPPIKVPLPVAGLAAGEYVVSIRQVVAEGDWELTSTTLRIEPQANALLQP